MIRLLPPSASRPRRSGAAALLTAAVLGAVLTAATVLTGCGSDDAPAASNGVPDTVTVGVAWPLEKRSSLNFEEGLELALKQANADAPADAPVLEIAYSDDGESVGQARRVAQQFADDPSVRFVIGHMQSYTTLAAAPIYRRANMLQVSPLATDPDLISEGDGRLFRLMPDNRKIGEFMAQATWDRGHRKVLVTYAQNEYGRDLANSFEARARSMGIDVVHRESFNAQAVHTGRTPTFVERWNVKEFDAIFLAGSAPSAAYVIDHIRNTGIDVPIFGGDALGEPSVIRLSGDNAEGLIVPSIFHPSQTSPVIEQFKSGFQATYDQMPGPAAALGYDAFGVLAEAIHQTQSADPAVVAKHLRTMSPYDGVTGRLHGQDDGALQVMTRPNKDTGTAPFILISVQDGTFQPLPSDLAQSSL